MDTECVCDRKRVCEILGQCFHVHRLIIQLPGFLHKQKDNARSVKQVYQLFKLTKLINGQKTNSSKI